MQHCDFIPLLPFYLLLTFVSRYTLQILRIMSDSSFASKNNATIEQGDTVHTKFRGGKHEGKVRILLHDVRVPVLVVLVLPD